MMQSPVRIDNRWLTASSFGHSSSFIPVMNDAQCSASRNSRINSDDPWDVYAFDVCKMEAVVIAAKIPSSFRSCSRRSSSNNTDRTVVVRECFWKRNSDVKQSFSVTVEGHFQATCDLHSSSSVPLPNELGRTPLSSEFKTVSKWQQSSRHKVVPGQLTHTEGRRWSTL